MLLLHTFALFLSLFLAFDYYYTRARASCFCPSFVCLYTLRALVCYLQCRRCSLIARRYTICILIYIYIYIYIYSFGLQVFSLRAARASSEELFLSRLHKRRRERARRVKKEPLFFCNRTGSRSWKRTTNDGWLW